MRATSGYTIVNKQNFLAKELRRRGLLNVAISERKGYKHGMAQPAVLVLRKDGTVLETILPKRGLIVSSRPWKQSLSLTSFGVVNLMLLHSSASC